MEESKEVEETKEKIIIKEEPIVSNKEVGDDPDYPEVPFGELKQ